MGKQSEFCLTSISYRVPKRFIGMEQTNPEDLCQGYTLSLLKPGIMLKQTKLCLQIKPLPKITHSVMTYNCFIIRFWGYFNFNSEKVFWVDDISQFVQRVLNRVIIVAFCT